MKTRILGICNVFLLIFGSLILKEYIANHTYYYDMLNNTSNIYIIIATLVCAAIPIAYILYWKNATLKGLAWLSWIGLLIYGISYASIRESILGTGAIMRAINTFIIFGLSVFMLVAMTTIGTLIYKKLYGEKEQSLRSLLLSFGLGFVAFTVFNYALILLNVYHPIVNWIQLLGLGFLIRKNKNTLSPIKDFINDYLRSLFIHKKYDRTNWVIVALLLISVAYYFIGFKLAYIPYPTARDANHAYMLIPNAITNGGERNRQNSQNTAYLPVYLSFLSFFFSIAKGLGSGFWISPDTFGVEMNYLTAIFTFITTIGIINKVLSMVKSKSDHHETLISSIGWFVKILWMTSGMGAFLVFVDNKSDFGIMYLSCLGLYAGLGYVDYLIKKYNDNKEDDISRREGHFDLYLSAIFFGIAVTSKITALFDAMNFVLLIVGFLMGGLVLIGVAFIILGVLAILNLNGYSNFISPWFKNVFGFGGGTLLTIVGLAKGQKTHSMSYWPRLVNISKQIALRGVIFIATCAVLKSPIGLYRYFTDQTTLDKLPKEVIFGKQESAQKKFILLASNTAPQLLLAQNGLGAGLGAQVGALPAASDTVTKPAAAPAQAPAKAIKQLSFEQCTLQGVGLTENSQLYDDLQNPENNGYNEDVGRYVGFGQKQFNNPWWGFMVPEEACWSLNSAASVMCKNVGLINDFSVANLKTLLGKLKLGSDGYELVSLMIAQANAPDKLSTFNSDSQKVLNEYRKDKVITKDGSSVFVPFKVVVPFNVTFNRSLQNLSSYYTDIGIIWLILQFFLIIGVIYGIVSKNRLLWTMNLVAVIGWLLWITIGGGIVWYGIGLITWTIMGFVVFIHGLYEEPEKNEANGLNHTLYYGFLVLFSIFGVIQLSLNFIRIASQGGAGAFLQYRYSNGQELYIDDNLQQTVSIKFPYKSDDILSLQFPHYAKVLNAINAQTGDEINLIAGTYSQYRIKDQSRIYFDGLLNDTRKLFSDRNLCKTYLRLQDKKLKYLIIDPNIASIVMGGGNNSLMERFFAKIDPVSGKIVTDGTMTELGKLINGGYLKLYYSNNLAAKYGFLLSTDELKNKFGLSNDEDVAMLRARLATIRFWGNQEQLIKIIAQVFTERIVSGEGVIDIADVFGKVIDEDKLLGLVSKAKTEGFSAIQADIKGLTQDERFTLLNYLNLITTYNRQPAQFGSVANNIISQSLGGGSQLIVFEVPQQQ